MFLIAWMTLLNAYEYAMAEVRCNSIVIVVNGLRQHQFGIKGPLYPGVIFFPDHAHSGFFGELTQSGKSESKVSKSGKHPVVKLG